MNWLYPWSILGGIQKLSCIKGEGGYNRNMAFTDNYSKEILQEQFTIHREYVKSRISSGERLGIKFRLPSIPEDISENIIKFIIRNKLGDPTSRWDCKGDLLSIKEGKQECKCFTSDGPPSFTPTSEWDVIYFLDARKWLENKFVLFRVSLKRTSVEWQSIKVNRRQTFAEQCEQGRRPRITWDSLYPQIRERVEKMFEGSFEDIFAGQEA